MIEEYRTKKKVPAKKKEKDCRRKDEKKDQELVIEMRGEADGPKAKKGCLDNPLSICQREGTRPRYRAETQRNTERRAPRKIRTHNRKSLISLGLKREEG